MHVLIQIEFQFPKLKEVISGVYQEYKNNNNGNPLCTRNDDPGKNMVDDPSMWKVSIPHPQTSGICYTYK